MSLLLCVQNDQMLPPPLYVAEPYKLSDKSDKFLTTALARPMYVNNQLSHPKAHACSYKQQLENRHHLD